ncbi:MAG TPA: dTDP-4-dehydrorhamnose 3,5-epimerase [Isosphaeraceae bacterium]
MIVNETRLPGVVVIEPAVHSDDRGFLTEVWNQRRFDEAGLDVRFVQDNLSSSRRGVLRGLHYQWPAAQGKLVYVLQGEVYDVAVDIRAGSPSYGQWIGVTLSSDTKHQIYIPPGFAHGFAVLSATALVLYKCTGYYTPSDEGSIRWDDPAIAIDWPISDPVLATKDAQAPRLTDVPPERLPTFGPRKTRTVRSDRPQSHLTPMHAGGETEPAT